MQSDTTLNQHQLTNRSDNMSQVSLRKGYWFYFDHEGNDISMFGSAWNGKEIVYFNNKPVSEFRNITKLKSQHRFEAKGRQYKVKTEMKSIMRGTLKVTLECDGDIIDSEEVSYSPKGSFRKEFFSKNNLLFLAACFAIGAALGYFVL